MPVVESDGSITVNLGLISDGRSDEPPPAPICIYEKWRQLPAGPELDAVVNRKVFYYPKGRRARKWSTDPRHIAELMDALAEERNGYLSITRHAKPAADGDTAFWWSVEYEYRGHPAKTIPSLNPEKKEWTLPAVEPFMQEGEGETLNLALCRALLHIDCNNCPHCLGDAASAVEEDAPAPYEPPPPITMPWGRAPA